MSRVLFAWIPLFLALLALVVCLLFAMTTLYAMRLHRVSRKCYVLLLNRTVGDICACLIAIAAVPYWLRYEAAADAGQSETVRKRSGINLMVKPFLLR